MQNVLDLDGPICANLFADSRESPDSRESVQGSRTEPPFFANRASGGLQVANRRFEAIRVNLLKRYENRVFPANRFTRIDSCESPRFALRITGPSRS